MSLSAFARKKFIGPFASTLYRLAGDFNAWANPAGKAVAPAPDSPVISAPVVPIVPDPVEFFKREQIVAYRKQEAAEYYERQLAHVRRFLKKEGFVVAEALLDMVVEQKAGKPRNDGYNPAISHEIDQLLRVVTAHEQGRLKQDRAEIERHHGSIEKWLNSIILHDVGEDKRYFYGDLLKDARPRVFEKLYGGPPNDPDFELPEEQEALLERAGRSMERLTHARKFKLDEFEALTGESLGFTGDDLETLKNGGQIDLRGRYNEFFWNKINCFRPEDKATPDNMQVYATWNEKRNKPVVMVTQYGASDELGMDWHIYVSHLTNHIYDMMTKIGDRTSNISTRFGSTAPVDTLVNFNLQGHRDYFADTHLLLEQIGAGKVTAKNFSNTPLEPYIKSENAMLGVVYTGGTFYMRHHPAYNHGDKLRDPAHVEQYHIHTSKYFDENQVGDANLLYGYMPDKSYPFYKLFQQLGDVTGQDLKRGHRKLWHTMVDAFADTGGEVMKVRVKRLRTDMRKVKNWIRTQAEVNAPEFLSALDVA